MELNLVACSTANIMVTASDADDRTTWARAIHDRSGSADRPFVAVRNEAGPTADGAQCVDRWFRQATGGTLFIDQIGNLSLRAQDRLLSLLAGPPRRQDRATSLDADHRVRVITGSNRSLRADLTVGSFSDTLFYRLNMIHIDLMHQHKPGEPAMNARDIMSAPAYTCGPNTDLATVAKIMWDHDCGFVPVVDASGTVTGVVTDRDICIATSTRRLLPEHISATQAMTTPIHACLADDSVSDVLATMRQCQIRRVPVIDANGRLQGVISLNDIVLASTEKREPQASDVIATMAAICAHRRVEAAVA
jgi:CBS domain-containing protein